MCQFIVWCQSLVIVSAKRNEKHPFADLTDRCSCERKLSVFFGTKTNELIWINEDFWSFRNNKRIVQRLELSILCRSVRTWTILYLTCEQKLLELQIFIRKRLRCREHETTTCVWSGDEEQPVTWSEQIVSGPELLNVNEMVISCRVRLRRKLQITRSEY